MRHLIIFCSLLYVVCAAFQYSGNPRVRVGQGIASGSWKKSAAGRQFAAFEGLPYAKPPVGKYRFREPQKPKPWVGIWDASGPSSSCIQNDPFSEDEGNEDCLYLNIYTPNPNGIGNLPVIVYIHGGSFMYGSGELYGPKFIMDKEVVYITINYRLSVFGFLSTEDDMVPGNMGLKDQSLALHWIKDNIMMFGGDSNSITIMGLSAGGASVHYHYLSPKSRGTFNRGISFGGCALNPWAMSRNPLAKARALAAHIGCPIVTNREMVECLKYRPAKVLMQATKIFKPWRDINLMPDFTPVIEPPLSIEPFMNQLPYDIMRSGKAQQLPWIVAINSEEGLYPAAALASDKSLQELDKKWEVYAPHIFAYNDSLPATQKPMASSKIRQHYLKGKPLTRENFPHLVQALGERNVVNGMEKAARLQAAISKEPVYFYRFSYRGPQSVSDLLSGTTNNYGTCHGDDTYYITDTSYINISMTAESIAMSKYMIDIVYSYATTGIPDAKSVAWEPLVGKTKEMKYLQIRSPTDQQMKTALDLGNTDFWQSFGFAENEKASSSSPRDEF